MPIHKAIPQDAEALTTLTLTSKAYWGYGAAQMASWQDQLDFKNNYIENHQVYKLVTGETLIGYYSYVADKDVVVLDRLFVLPEYIGQGFGRKLVEDFLTRVKSAGHTKVVLEADPNAEGFYNALGFTTAHYLPTETQERFLPAMQLYL
jgi:GNAT superfamily N-acetyltransferase